MDREDPIPYVGLNEAYCEGARDPNRYVCLLTVSAAKVAKGFSHDGSSELDRIHAFDLTETEGAYLGQLNLIRVSSFCGPQGLVWGYDIADARPDNEQTLFSVGPVPVLSAEPLIAASRALLGTVDAPRFPIMPGSLCPAAYNSITAEGPCVVFAAFGMGIRKDGSASASVLMEDKGTFPTSSEAAARRDLVLRKIAESVIAVARNQHIELKEVRVGYRETIIAQGEVGCALAAMPYVVLAKNVLPEGGIDALRRSGLAEWASEKGLTV